jgi:hypothetical protein
VEGQSFIFRAETAGTYILKFYKQDFIQDYVINDHVQLIIGEASENTGSIRPGPPIERERVIAEPRWPPATGSPVAVPGTTNAPGTAGLQPTAAPVEAAPPSTPAPVSAVSPTPDTAARPMQTVTDEGIVPVAPPQTASPAEPQYDSPAEYVRRAGQEFDAGRVEQALSIMDAMKRRFPLGTDEAWWLYGQLLEANSPSRDIRLALEYYQRLVREYPQSNRVAAARQRIAYLERYYFNIR